MIACCHTFLPINIKWCFKKKIWSSKFNFELSYFDISVNVCIYIIANLNLANTNQIIYQTHIKYKWKWKCFLRWLAHSSTCIIEDWAPNPILKFSCDTYHIDVNFHVTITTRTKKGLASIFRTFPKHTCDRKWNKT